MGALPTAEENGKLVLQIYAHFDSRPGQVLRSNNFLAVAARRRIPTADIQSGLEYAAEMKWIEETENGSLRLTERGFGAMPQPNRSH
jgi:hypothetical protein